MKVTKVAVSSKSDLIWLFIEEGEKVCPYTYAFWGGTPTDVKENFRGEVEDGDETGFAVDAILYANELADPAVIVIYTEQEGWLV